MYISNGGAWILYLKIFNCIYHIGSGSFCWKFQKASPECWERYWSNRSLVSLF